MPKHKNTFQTFLSSPLFTFIKYASLFAVFSAFTALFVIFGLNIIDIPGISYPLTITFGVLSGLVAGITLLYKGQKSFCCGNWEKSSHNYVPPSGGGGGKPKKSGSEHDYLFKFLVVGDSKIGKTELLGRFKDGLFINQYIATIGVDFGIKTIELDDKKIKLQIWDTAGQERFRTIVTSYYRGCHGVLLVFDVTNRASFENIEKWKKEIEKQASEVNIILVGHKMDKASKREVSQDEAKRRAQELGIPYIETSAKTGVNVKECFEQLALAVMQRLGLVQGSDQRPINRKDTGSYQNSENAVTTTSSLSSR